uniref:Secreted protein n=1 Tax=Oncorhynchus kisutch TaxID=8019 RepID=A0A8C7M584_ONCKI
MGLFSLICVAVSFTHVHCQSNHTFVTPGRGKRRLHIVRRAALQALLEHERQQYVIELNRLGKTIYKQRV